LPSPSFEIALCAQITNHESQITNHKSQIANSTAC